MQRRNIQWIKRTVMLTIFEKFDTTAAAQTKYVCLKINNYFANNQLKTLHHRHYKDNNFVWDVNSKKCILEIIKL